MLQFLERLGLYKGKEALSTISGNRILILGTRSGGAYGLAKGFQEYFEESGIQDFSVEVLRDAGLIEKSFLNLADSRNLETARVPQGVVLLPEMRQYDNGRGMFLNTYECEIDKFVYRLCNQHNVPLVTLIPSPDYNVDSVIREFLWVKSRQNK